MSAWSGQDGHSRQPAPKHRQRDQGRQRRDPLESPRSSGLRATNWSLVRLSRKRRRRNIPTQHTKLKANSTSISAALFQLGARLRRSGSRGQYADEEPPLRSELFSADQMEQHGKALAASHKLAARRARDQLLARLAENEGVLIEACNLLTAAVKANRRITPAGEWLLDNFYLIEEQIRTARRHLPRGYSRELPRLAHGPSAGLPRVYDIALETISHGDGRVDTDSLSRFVAAYQTRHRAHARRIVGHPDHAAPGADRESAPRRSAASPPAGSTGTWPTPGRTR